MRAKALAALFCCLIGFAAHADSVPLRLWYSQPANDWEREALPIGNGAMGAMVFGGIPIERLQFNEKTLWTGGPGSSKGYDFGIPDRSSADAVRRIAERLNERPQLPPEEVVKHLGRRARAYGDYQTFGDVMLAFAPNDAQIEDYRRELDLENAILSVSFRQGGVRYKREYFASYPDDVIVVRLTADRPASISLRAWLAIPENRSRASSVQGGRISVEGALDDNKLKYAAALQVLHEGGSRSELMGDQIGVAGADAVTLILAAGTNYALQYPAYRGEDPGARVQQRVSTAAEQQFTTLRERHVRDHRELFGRVMLDVGQRPAELPTDQLLASYGKNSSVADRYLEAVYFQYGRYLLIASSRAGSLPANLQGVWNHSNTPPWNADYHVNINLQMNYWLAEPTNLRETTAPLFDFIDALVTPGRRAARQIVGVPGWTLFLNTNIWGYTGVIDWPTAFWQPESAAWLAQHYYEHFLFSRDATFLRERAWPVMKEAAEFWLNALRTDPRDDTLVVSPSYSPEHGPFTAGAAMSQQIVVDLFINVLEAAHLLEEQAFAERVASALQKLDRGTRIGSWGQLQEWKLDLDDPKNDHRHVSHLYALHPGRQIAPSITPELTAAARVSLNARGDGGTGWSKAWKINFWARLHDGDRAHKLLGEQLRSSTLPNLLDTHPPFQIDGNFGATAGVAEMLLQSHVGEIHLLPALPKAWDAGQVRGLRARGNLTIDLDWQAGQLRRALLYAGSEGPVVVRSGLCEARCELVDRFSGARIALQGQGARRGFQAQAGRTYELREVE